MSWAYCAPKSTTSTVGKSISRSAADNQVDPLELLEVAVAGLGHRPAQRPEQVGPPVGLLGRAEQHLLQRAGRRQRRGGATARQPRVRGDRVPPDATGGAPPGGPQRAPAPG